MEPAGSRMYRTYRSFPLGRQWMSPYLNHCWVKLVNYYLTSGVKLPDAICRYSTVFYGRNLGRETRHKWGGRVIRVSGNCTHFLCRKPPRKSFPRRRNKLKSLGLNRSSDRLIETSLQRKKERKNFESNSNCRINAQFNQVDSLIDSFRSNRINLRSLFSRKSGAIIAI